MRSANTQGDGQTHGVPVTSIVLVLALIVIHVAVVGLGGHLEKGLEEGGLSGLEGALILGANVGPWVRSGEVWRWVTSTLLHTGWLHLDRKSVV